MKNPLSPQKLWLTPPCTRRHILQIGGLGLMGVSLSRLLESRARAATTGIAPLADNAIILFLSGGPSHIDMWDMKPEASAEIRGEFSPIATTVPGYQISDQMPKLAQQVHRATVVRSMHHSVNNAHAAAVYTSMTGHDRGDAKVAIGASPQDYPCFGSVMQLLRPTDRPVVPHVSLPDQAEEGKGGPPQPGYYGGILGKSYDPLFVLKDPNAPDFAVPELTLMTDVTAQRLTHRRDLFSALDQQLRSEQSQSVTSSMSSFQDRAMQLLLANETQKAFQISDEPDSLRDRYGRNIYGQSVLMARRLIEAGTRVVSIAWAPDANSTWDTHGSNFVSLRNVLLPQFDAACATLIADLADRGRLDRTLVIVLGDFGRTPKITGNGPPYGRDHWNFCYSIMLAGGGIKGGYQYGASDAIGAFPASSPLVPGDVVSTIYHALGISHEELIYDKTNRPHRLVPEGDVVYDLLA
ncbi:MAG: DUF1501 domain-containing protein [Planctomycetaceae bacterium]